METPAVLPPDQAPAPQGADAEAQALETADQWSPSALAGRLVEVTSAPAAAFPRTTGHPSHDESARIWDTAAPMRGVGPAALSAATTLVWKAQLAGEPCAWIAARPSTFYPPDLDEGGIDLAALVVVRAPHATAAARVADKLLRSGAFGLVVLDLGDGSEATATATTPCTPSISTSTSPSISRATSPSTATATTSREPVHISSTAAGLRGRPRARGLSIPPALTSRLLGLAQKHRATVVFVTEKADDAPSVAPVVSLRVAATRRRTATGASAAQGGATRAGSGTGRFVCSVEATKDKRRPPGWTWQETFRGPPGLR